MKTDFLTRKFDHKLEFLEDKMRLHSYQNELERARSEIDKRWKRYALEQIQRP